MVTNNRMRHQQSIGRGFGPDGRPSMAAALAMVALAVAVLASCRSPEPKALLRVTDIETYWVLDPSRTEKRLLAPAVRFRVENVSSDTLIAVDAIAAFFRDGSKEAWGSGSFRLTEGRKRMVPGAKVLVTMSSDARYSLEGAPETAFTHPTFKSVSVKFFLRVGSSVWVEFGKSPVENVIGSKDARAVLNQPR